MKARYGLVIFLVAVLDLVGAGCFPVGNKATGGGWFIDQGAAKGRVK